MNIKIELTQEDHAALMEMLNELADLRYDQAAALATVPEAEDRYRHCLQQARAATKLLMNLSRY